ncbi:MAG: DUF1559 domain-containing protein [Gemmatales bacterium]
MFSLWSRCIILACLLATLGLASITNAGNPLVDDEKALQGTWHCVAFVSGGKDPAPADQVDEMKNTKLIITNSEIKFIAPGRELKGKFNVDTTVSPKHLTISIGEKVVQQAIYTVDNDLLVIASGPGIDEFPKSFSVTADKYTMLMVFQKKALDQNKSKSEPKAAAPTMGENGNKMKQVALAFHNYAQAYQNLPRNICDKDGKPLLSWRVAILPFLEQENLYRQFKLDEPWDSDHNKELISKMPAIYGWSDSDKRKSTTPIRAFIGNGAIVDAKTPLRFPDITDGTSNTLMIVEATNPVVWTKPEDLDFQPDKPLPKMGTGNDPNFIVAFMDGSVRQLPRNIKPDILKALITRNGGEIVEIPEPARKPDTTEGLPGGKVPGG